MLTFKFLFLFECDSERVNHIQQENQRCKHFTVIQPMTTVRDYCYFIYLFSFFYDFQNEMITDKEQPYFKVCYGNIGIVIINIVHIYATSIKKKIISLTKVGFVIF